MSATATRLTPEDLLDLPDDGKVYELVDGHLVEKPMSKESNRIGGEIHYHVRHFCGTQRIGWTFPQDSGFRCFSDEPNRVRKPDTAFVSFRRMPRASYTDEGYITAVPDLVAEVISPNDNGYDIETKINEWLAAGVRLVWVVYPHTLTIRVLRGDGAAASLRVGDTLSGDDVLPGFAVPASDLFQLPEE